MGPWSGARASSAAALACMMSACGPHAADRFPVPIDKAYAALATNDLNEFKLARQCGILLHITPAGSPDGLVVWSVTSSGEPVLTFRAELTQVSERETQVDVKIDPLPNGREPYDGTETTIRPAFRQPLRPAVEEAIASALENRPFDGDRLDKDSNIQRAEDPPEVNARKTALADINGACNLQRAGLESGEVVFSVHDKPGQPYARSR